MGFIKQILCEYLDNPIGIDHDAPRISYTIEETGRSIFQEYYQIQTSTDDTFSEILSDSGLVHSSNTTHIEIPKLKLESFTRYYYRIKAWTTKSETAWTTAHWFETGFLSTTWQGKWITANIDEQVPQFRKEFESRSAIKKARLYITARGLYEATINGSRVGDFYLTPGWTNYNDRIQYQTYDVTDMIKNEGNVLSVMLGKGWYSGNIGFNGGEDDYYGKEQSFLAELHIVDAHGEKTIITSDSSWGWLESPILHSEIYHGEEYDSRLGHDGWHEHGFNKTLHHAIEVDAPLAKIVAQENEPVKRQELITPIEIIQTPRGETVLDFGQNMVGFVQFKVRGKKSSVVTLKHFEVLDSEGNVYLDNLRRAKQTVTYTLNGDPEETFEPRFTFQGFRYVQLDGFNDDILAEDFVGVVLHSNMRKTGHFSCSDERINQLHQNIVWGQKGNFVDVPTDCPQRDERLGWTGDVQMFISTSSYLYNVGSFFTKWLRDLKSEQGVDGSVPFVIPNVLDSESHSSAAWGDAAVISPWVLYLNYGDERILRDQFSSMKAWVEYIYNQGEDPYLWNTGFHFGDWVALDAQPGSYIGATDRDLIATAFYAYSTSLLSKAAYVLGYEAEGLRYERLYNDVKQAFNKEFVTENGRLSVSTQTSHLLALQFDLVEGTAKKRTEQRLEQLLKDSDYHLKTGFVGTPYLNLVLTKAGMDQIASKLLFQNDYPSWLYQVENGATTIWEHWDGIREDGSFWSADMNSFNHYAYGSIGDWLYRKVAGIDCDESKPGFKNIHFEPHFINKLDWAESSLDSMQGKITSRWEKTSDSTVKWDIEIPANSSGTLKFPVNPSFIKESSTPLEKIEGVHLVRKTENGTVAHADSGNYSFTITLEA